MPKRKAASVVSSEPLHMSTGKRAKITESTKPPEGAPLSPAQATGPELLEDGGASRGFGGRPPGRGGSSHARSTRRGGQGGGRGRGGRAWRAWRGAPPNIGKHFGYHPALQYVDPKEKEEPPEEWIGPRRDALEARMGDLNMAYREVFAALKPALGELVNRDQEKLKADEDYHKNNVHYTKLKEDLDKRLQQEIKLIEIKGKLELEQEELRVRVDRASINDNYKAKVEGIREDFLTHIKLETMRKIISERLGKFERGERGKKGPDNYKYLVDVENSRALAGPRRGSNVPDDERFHHFYQIVDEIWDNWQQRTVDEPGKTHLPRPYKKTVGPKKIVTSSGWVETPHVDLYPT